MLVKRKAKKKNSPKSSYVEIYNSILVISPRNLLCPKVDVSEIVKGLMEKGIINFDLIKDSTLLGLILIETKDVEALSNIWNPDA